MGRLGPWALFVWVMYGAASSANADEILFNNGDRLSGTVVHLMDGRLTLDSPLLGKIELAIATIQTFSTTQPIEIHTKDGAVLNDVVLKGQPSRFRTSGAGPDGPQSLALADAVAFNPPAEEPPAWHGSLAAGIELERGNAFSNEADVALESVRESESNRIRFDASYEGDRTTNQDTHQSTTTERDLKVLLRYDRFLGEKLYWYGSGEAEKDGVKDLDLRSTAGAGLGYRWFDTEKLELDADLGLSWIRENYQNSSLDDDFIASVLTWSLRRRLLSPLAQGLTLFQRGRFWVDLESWDDQLLAEIVTGIRSDLTSKTFLELKIDWEYDSEVSTNKERIDVDYIFGLGVRF